LSLLPELLLELTILPQALDAFAIFSQKAIIKCFRIFPVPVSYSIIESINTLFRQLCRTRRFRAIGSAWSWWSWSIGWAHYWVYRSCRSSPVMMEDPVRQVWIAMRIIKYIRSIAVTWQTIDGRNTIIGHIVAIVITAIILNVSKTLDC
jgi:hypothetical protein